MIFRKNINEHASVLNKLLLIEDEVENAANLMTQSILKGGKLIFCGNGGSASDAQHISAEFIGRFVKERPSIPALSISTDTSALTCISNDYGYENVFSRQIEGIGNKNDCLVGISTSGNSINIENAIKVANKIGMSTIGLLGRDGGNMSKYCNQNIIVQDNVTARIQEMHILIGHSLVEMVEMGITLK